MGKAAVKANVRAAGSDSVWPWSNKNFGLVRLTYQPLDHVPLYRFIPSQSTLDLRTEGHEACSILLSDRVLSHVVWLVGCVSRGELSSWLSRMVYNKPALTGGGHRAPPCMHPKEELYDLKPLDRVRDWSHSWNDANGSHSDSYRAHHCGWCLGLGLGAQQGVNTLTNILRGLKPRARECCKPNDGYWSEDRALPLSIFTKSGGTTPLELFLMLCIV